MQTLEQKARSICNSEMFFYKETWKFQVEMISMKSKLWKAKIFYILKFFKVKLLLKLSLQKIDPKSNYPEQISENSESKLRTLCEICALWSILLTKEILVIKRKAWSVKKSAGKICRSNSCVHWMSRFSCRPREKFKTFGREIPKLINYENFRNSRHWLV